MQHTQKKMNSRTQFLKPTRLAMAISIVAMVASPLLLAQDGNKYDLTSNWYGGLNIGQTHESINDGAIATAEMGGGLTSLTDDDRDNGYKLFAGYFSGYLYMINAENSAVSQSNPHNADGMIEMKRQQALLKTGALQNAILTSANFSIIATDEKGIIQLFNVGAERMLGYSAADVVNKINPSDIHDPQEVMARAKALSLELNTEIKPGFEALAFKASRGIEDIYELTYICKDGSRFPAIVSITPLRDDDHNLIGYLLIGTDNSQRKQVELKLNQAMAVAEKANLAKSDFLSSMSHELRTPLSAILGFAQLIESGTPPPTASQKRSIDQILQAGWYLLDLINEILDLALIESQAHKREVNVTFPPFDAHHFVKADRTRVKQVLINLLSNAIKYNRVGGSVTVTCEERVPGRIRIAIEDTGEGLSAEKIEQLFQPFNRLGQEFNAEEGTGIGLVMTKRLIELMAGLRTNNTDAYLPVIVLTAQPAHKLRALQAGAKDFVSKPFDLLEVKTRISNMLEVRLLYKKLEGYNKLLEITVAERTAELRASEERYRRLTELASDWYWEQDEHGQFTKLSGPVQDMLGIQVVSGDENPNADEADGWSATERAQLHSIIAERQPFIDFAFSRTHQDGSQQHYRVSGEPMFDQACRFVGYRGIGVECKPMVNSHTLDSQPNHE